MLSEPGSDPLVVEGCLAPADLLAAVGPQRHDESLLARRVRFHQSWYRVAVLRLHRFGNTSGRVPRPLGSVLTDDDALVGWNFTSRSAQGLYERRRSEGWGVDPVRCTKYLNSSQALTLNLLGPLGESPAWAARVLCDILQRSDISAIEQIRVEFAPRRRSEYLNDMTRIDALLQMRTSQGQELLAAEIKYSDRFNSRRVNIDQWPYRQLAASTGLWREPGNTLQTRAVNQLVRCHALAAAVSREMSDTIPTPSLLVVHHKDDAASRNVVHQYTTHLSEDHLTRAVRLDELVAAYQRQARSPGQRHVARALELRYVAENESESAWRASADRSIRGKAKAADLAPSNEIRSRPSQLVR